MIWLIFGTATLLHLLLWPFSIRLDARLSPTSGRGELTAASLLVCAAVFAAGMTAGDLPAFGTGESPVPRDRARRGEMLYNDGSMCFQQWQSCASCHPDGRVDGLNWDLLNDGMGNPKQTRSELYNHVTPPTMIRQVIRPRNASLKILKNSLGV